MTKHPDPVIVATRPDATGGGARTSTWHGTVYVCAAVAILSGVLIFAESELAFVTGMIEGLKAVGIVAAASAAGLWLVWLTGNSDLPIRWQIGLGAGFGLGGLSLGTLMAGLRGHLGQRFWIVTMVLVAAAGIAAIYRLGRIARRQSLLARSPDDEAQASAAGSWRWLWLLVVPAIVLGVLVATVPPGMLWEEEGRGYDALEYHLGVPKEYYFLGRIEYLDHNVYSNFPMNAEMLYLAAMALHASPFKAAITAQMIHLLLGGLAGAAAWLIGSDYSRKAGILAGIAGVAFPWSIYLGGLAYVENGMLFYGLLAAGLCNRAIRDPGERCWQRALALGVMAGLACGYKYTAIPMIAVPLLGLWVVLNLSKRPAKFANALIPLLMAGAMFAPWMGKNQRMTGDPFFPLGHRVFGSRVWTDADYRKFQEGHSPVPAERPVGVRIERFSERVLMDARWGYVPWLIADLAGILAIWRRFAYRKEVAIWLIVLSLQAVLWLFTTHLFARFAGVMWIPLVLLMSAVAAWATGAPARAAPSAGADLADDGPGNDKKAADPFSSRRQTGGKEARRPHFAPKQMLGGGSHGQTRARNKAPDPLLRWPCVLAVSALVVYLGIGYNWIYREYRGHMYVNGQLLAVHGNIEAFFYGMDFINGNGQDNPGLPYDSKVLMVGDAKIFYVNRPCDYCVVFSRNRFAEAIEEAGGSADGVLRWLRQQGYTHVWADFSEIQRLSSTYGLPRQITMNLFQQLERAGLKQFHKAHIQVRGANVLYGILYEVPAS